MCVCVCVIKCTITNYSILQKIEEMYSESPELVSHRDAYGYSVPSSFKDGLELYFVLIQALEQYSL